MFSVIWKLQRDFEALFPEAAPRPLGILTSTDRTTQSKKIEAVRDAYPEDKHNYILWAEGEGRSLPWQRRSVLQPHPSDCSVCSRPQQSACLHTLCLWTTADCWLCPEAWGPSLKCQEINKAWEQGSTRTWVNGQIHRLPRPHLVGWAYSKACVLCSPVSPHGLELPFPWDRYLNTHPPPLTAPSPAGGPCNSQLTACPDLLSQVCFWGTKLGHPLPDMANFHLCVCNAAAAAAFFKKTNRWTYWSY